MRRTESETHRGVHGGKYTEVNRVYRNNYTRLTALEKGVMLRVAPKHRFRISLNHQVLTLIIR